jgi:proline iminopeptidase
MSRPTRFAGVAVVAVFLASFRSGAGQTTERFVTVAPDVRLFVQEEGRGTPVIVIHGGPGLDSRSVAPDLEPLARHHRVIFYDQRGSGRSTLSTDVTADVMVRDLDALRQRLGLARVALLGHSWGGGLAALYASAHPTRVSRLVLVSSMPLRAITLDVMEHNLFSRLTADESGKLRRIVHARLNATTEEEDVSSCRDYWAILLKAYYADPAAAARSRGEVCAGSGAALANGLRVNGSVLEGLGHFDLTSKMSRLRMPTLVIHGDVDPLPVESASQWAKTVPGARLLILPNSGHAPFVEQPDLFFHAVDQFLDGRWPSGAR